MDSLSLNAPDALVCAPTEKCRVPPMPIRFRCAYCNQLMGIGRRKAGTIVRCPKCAGEVIVPAAQSVPSATGPAFNPFEQDDFAEELEDLQAIPDKPGDPRMPPPAYS